jgi:hypothetical protein
VRASPPLQQGKCVANARARACVCVCVCVSLCVPTSLAVSWGMHRMRRMRCSSWESPGVSFFLATSCGVDEPGLEMGEAQRGGAFQA